MNAIDKANAAIEAEQLRRHPESPDSSNSETKLQKAIRRLTELRDHYRSEESAEVSLGEYAAGFHNGLELALAWIESRDAYLLTADDSERPSWDDAPAWARWLAQDENGKWHWFEGTRPPYICDYPGAVFGAWSSYWRSAIARIPDWRETLEERPHE